MRRKALVTGATGFVGSNLVKGLLHDGWQVDVIIRPTSNLKLLSDTIKQLNVYEYDGDINTLTSMMTESKPDVVFHVASLFLSSHRSDQVDSLIQSNILFGTQLLEAMSNAGVQYIVNTSTSWENYENKNYSPVNLYAATKWAFHGLLQYYVEAKNIRAITLKLFDTYGSNDPRPKILNLLLKEVDTGNLLSMSPGEQKIDLVHIDDVVNTYLVAANKLQNHIISGHEIYGLSTGKPVSLKTLVAIIEKNTGKKLNIEWNGRPYRDREMMVPAYIDDSLCDGSSYISITDGIRIIMGKK